MLSEKKIALVNILFVPYQKALKFVLSVMAIIFPFPKLKIWIGTEFFKSSRFLFEI